MFEAETTIWRGAHTVACVAAILCSLSLGACGEPSSATTTAQSAQAKPDASNPMVGTWVGDLNPGSYDMLVGCKFTADLAGCYTYLQPAWQPQRMQFRVNGSEIEVQPETTSNVQIYKMIDHDTMKIEVGDPRFMPDNLKRCPENDPEACEAFGRHVFGLDTAPVPTTDSSGDGTATPTSSSATP
jgi:hypothetical protein